MRTALLLLLALAAPGLSSTAVADVYKWVDEKGITHYSDQPVPGAIRIEIRTGNVAESRPATPEETEPDPSAQAAATNYRIEIVQPKNQESIINTGGTVNVQIRVSPSIYTLHRVSLYVDGKMVSGASRNALSYTLTEVPRGTHSVNAVITDETGKTLRESDPVEFTVRQESIAQPPVGPSLKPPPPKPQPRPRAANKVLTTQPSYGALNGSPAAIDPATNLPVVKKQAPKPGKP